MKLASLFPMIYLLKKLSVSLFYFFSLMGLVILTQATKLSAEEKRNFTYYIEWKNVSGAKGYLIQIKDKSKGTEQEEKLNQNSIELKLPSGYYEYRIASINKFGKASSLWTNWEEFHVDKDKPKPGSKTAKTEEPEAKPPDNKEPNSKIKKWKWFIPGLTQYQSDKKLYGSLWVLWFTGLAIYGNSERVAGNRLASDKLNDPKFLSVLALGTPVTLDLYLWEKRNQAKGEYNSHQSNQAVVGAVALISYALQVWHAKRVSEKNTVSIELNSRREQISLSRGFTVDNPMLSFELKISMRY